MGHWESSEQISRADPSRQNKARIFANFGRMSARSGFHLARTGQVGEGDSPTQHATVGLPPTAKKFASAVIDAVSEQRFALFQCNSDMPGFTATSEPAANLVCTGAVFQRNQVWLSSQFRFCWVGGAQRPKASTKKSLIAFVCGRRAECGFADSTPPGLLSRPDSAAT